MVKKASEIIDFYLLMPMYTGRGRGRGTRGRGRGYRSNGPIQATAQVA